ncbi:MAG: (Fe-S)-binding protein [Deltaproteobacteria bacterium]|nr:(Fe-S)-binding protein [Deltaproteobacteria bacterium]
MTLTWQQELKKCVKCGACMAVCPIYRQTGREEMVARGKLNLIERVDLEKPAHKKEIPAGWLEAIDSCLLCCSCEENCSKGVKITEIIAAARNRQSAKQGLNPIKKSAFALLLNRFFSMARLLKAGSFMQWLLWRRLPRHSGLVRRLPLPGIDDKTVIPALPRQQLDDYLRKRKAAPNLEPVLYFPGCATRYLYPQMGLDLIYVLEQLGFYGVVPPEFNCCGLVTWGAGDSKSTMELQQRNLAVIQKHAAIRQIVTGCASCGHALKEYDGLPADCEILDISEFLFRHKEKLEKLVGSRKLNRKITYHDPCHLRKGQKITAQPRWLLQLIAGENFVEMRHPERCCGAGGTFGLSHKALSRKILAEKTRDTDASGAEIVASGCPGCLLQLTEGALLAESSWEARHPVTVLADLLKNDAGKENRKEVE